MNQLNPPFYKEIDTKRTQGEWHIAYGHISNCLGIFRKEMLDKELSESPICLISPIDKIDDTDKANAAWIKLSSNNLAKIADALSKAVAQEERRKSIAEITQESYIQPIWLNEAKEALKGIS